ncbi:unnamed protein product [Closterium sp. Yama58-4]|nr:unnamed protein product [Closterium sp. Yama58-4]
MGTSSVLRRHIILRVGDSGSNRSTYAPFEDGINGVRREILSWSLRDKLKQNRVPLQVLRGNSRLDIWARVTPSAVAEAAAAEAAEEAAQGDVSLDGSYDDTTASFGLASYRRAGTFETDCSYDAGENLLEGVVLSEGRHALFAPLAAWTEESILRLERIKAYGALRNNKPRAVEKEEQRNKRGSGLYSRMPSAGVRARRAAGIGCCFAGAAESGEGSEEAEGAEEMRSGAEDSLPAREAVGKLAEGIARLRMGWARARDGAEEAEGVRAPLLAHAVHPAERGDVGAQDSGRGEDDRLKRGGAGMLRDARIGRVGKIRISDEPSSDSPHDEIKPADTLAAHESNPPTASADSRASYGTRSTTAATSAGEPRVVLPHLYSKVPVSGEGGSGAGWGRWEDGETCIQEEEEEGDDGYWRERADDTVAAVAAGDAGAAGAGAGGSAGPTLEEARDMGARTRPSSPTHHTTTPAASTILATDAAAAGTAAEAEEAEMQERLWAGRAVTAPEARLWRGHASAMQAAGMQAAGMQAAMASSIATDGDTCTDSLPAGLPTFLHSGCLPAFLPAAPNLPAHATPGPVLKVRRHCIAEAAEKDDSGGSNKSVGGSGPASLFTILIMPAESGGKKESRRFFDVNHTIDRALRWFASVRASGAALELMNAQTEVLPVRLGGMDGDKLSKMAQYGKWTVKTNDEQRGDHISVLRAVRLWLVPDSEVELTLVLASGGVNNAACPPDWGLLLEQTPEGVVHVVGIVASCCGNTEKSATAGSATDAAAGSASAGCNADAGGFTTMDFPWNCGVLPQTAAASSAAPLSDADVLLPVEAVDIALSPHSVGDIYEKRGATRGLHPTSLDFAILSSLTTPHRAPTTPTSLPPVLFPAAFLSAAPLPYSASPGSSPYPTHRSPTHHQVRAHAVIAIPNPLTLSVAYRLVVSDVIAESAPPELDGSALMAVLQRVCAWLETTDTWLLSGHPDVAMQATVDPDEVAKPSQDAAPQAAALPPGSPTLLPLTPPPITLPPITLPPLTLPPITLPPLTLPPLTLPTLTLPLGLISVAHIAGWHTWGAHKARAHAAVAHAAVAHAAVVHRQARGGVGQQQGHDPWLLLAGGEGGAEGGWGADWLLKGEKEGEEGLLKKQEREDGWEGVMVVVEG